ncbi:stromal interaction molecule 1-like isoform X2 [Actinia tenebrosa]|uniref:Stromal interaction molecule 1-like isoform X2 n=1 Tax=Actinia tenebrosa TaxID=6105 RepID=A0A6P8IGP6_ACTTE|nr:stromal interaction molecule 1-like isoform X2 [Actinia tenebrosa]
MFRLILVFLVLTGFQASHHHELELKIDESEQSNYEAIGKIHSHLDDDRDGEVDISESDEFIRDELKVTDKNSRNLFHGNDTQISVSDLWNSWIASEVHNWSNAQVVSWLVEYVHLPQYVDDFTSAGINGSMLPRLAAQPSNGVFLGIKDPKHRKKISLRAMDVILFGPPASGHNFIKDIVVAFSVLVATLGCWLAVHQKRRAKKQMDQMMKDLCVLQQAEQNFGELQDRLIKAEEEHQLAIQEKADLEMRLMEEKKSAKLHDAKEGNKEQLQRLEDAEHELIEVRKALRLAQKELEYQSWRAPSALREWLQMTYSKETKHFHAKRSQALKQMAEAKEACERIRKKRNSLIGSFRMAHDLTIDEVDQYILKARASLAEVTKELEERQHRWSQIESLCGLQIMANATSEAPSGSSGTGSAIAKALANCANIGSVGSGRKLSGATPPKLLNKLEDLPPTYSSVAVQNSPDLNLSRATDSAPVVDSNGPVSVNIRVPASSKPARLNHSQPCIINGHDSVSDLHVNDASTIVSVGSIGSGNRTTNDSNLEVDPLPLINGSLDSFSGSKHSPPGSKSKKKLNWFGKRNDSMHDVELVNGAESEEEKRRKKIKWLWRSAALKSTARPKEQNGKHENKRDSIS